MPRTQAEIGAMGNQYIAPAIIAPTPPTDPEQPNATPVFNFCKYMGNTGNLTVQATAQSGTTAFVYLFNPIGSSKVIRLRRLASTQSNPSTTAFPSAPRINLIKFTFTGTWNGGQGNIITTVPIDSKMPAPQGIFTLVPSTGVTITVVGIMKTITRIASTMTATGVALPAVEDTIIINEEDAIVIRQGEGVMIQQSDNGTTSDVRIFDVDFVWDEYIS